MRRIYLLLLTAFLFATTANAQLTGTKNIPGDYADLAAAITDLNAQGVGAGGVVLNLLSGNPQTAPAGGYSITTLTGTAVNTIVLDGNGNTITASAALTAGALNDAIFKIIGSDYVTIQGFTMNENGANTTTAAASNNMTEWGVALLYTSTTDGAQNCTIQNNTITLNRTYANTFGIYSNSTHSATAVSTSATATTTAGGNSGLKIYANNISNVNNGIIVVGPTAVADFNTGVEIGGSAPLANIITNFGTTGTFSSYANVSGTVNGILVRNSLGFTISYNSITSSSGASGVTAGGLNGIQVPAASTTGGTTTATSNINNNTLALTSHVSGGAINGINLPSGHSTLNTTININANNFTALNHTIAAATGLINAITQSGSGTNGPLDHSISNNTFTNLTSSSTGSFTFISNNWSRPANAVCNINNNSIVTAFNKTGAGGTVTFYNSNSTSPTTVTEINNGNNFSNITVTGATTIAGWVSTDGSTVSPFGPGKTVTNNTFSNITGGTSAITLLTVAYSNSGSSTNNVSGNILSNISSAGAITGYASQTASQNVFNNSIFTLSSTGASAVTGISITGATLQNVYKNKIYDLQSNNATGTCFGITISATTTNAAINVYNNLIGDLRAIATSSTTDAIRGINMTGLATTGTLNISHNTIYLNATSSGANFSTSGVFHTTSTTATTSTLNLINNIIVNVSTPNGTGITSAYRRSSTTLTNYGAASNNNLFYAGTPSATNLIFYDGTNSDQALAAYKARVSPRDASSVTEDPPFISTDGSTDDFLHIDAGTATQVESGGAPLGSVTDDYDGEARNGSTPDIGADEFNGVSADLIPPVITYTPLGNTCTTTGVTLTATITDASGVPTAGAGLPVLYWRINAGAYTAATATHLGGNQYQFSFGSGVVLADVVSYYIVAQDLAGTPNVGSFPVAGAAGFTANPPAAATPPTTPSSFTIQSNLNGTYTVGAGGNFTTITAAVAAYNSSCLAGPVIFALTDAAYNEGTGETYPIIINANPFASSSNTLTIKPATGVTPVISGAPVTSMYMIQVRSNYVIIDGSNTVSGTTRDMTISNLGTTSPSALLYASTGTTPNVGGTVKNTIFINGLNTTSNVVVGGSTSTPSSAVDGYCNDFTFQNNSSRFTNHGIYITLVPATGNGSGTIITGNDFAGTGANAVKQSAITLIAVDGATVTNNTIGNLDQVTAEVDKGIWLQAGTINTTVSGNTIDNLGFSGTGATGNAYGIWIASANATSNITVSGNTISQLTSAGMAGTTIGTTGIYLSAATGGVTIERNTIRNIKSTNTAGYASSGIQLSSTSTVANTTVRNNMISDVASYGNVTVGPRNGYGIIITAGAGYSLYYNTVHMNSDQTDVGGLPAAINITSGVSVAGAIDLRNNIFSNAQTIGTNRYAIYCGAANTVFSNIDYNDYYTTGPNLGFIGSDRALLTDIQTGFGGNTNSENVEAFFASATDLHLLAAGNAGLDGQATPIIGIATDFDLQARNATTPDLGADEFTPAAGVDMGATALVSPAASGCYTNAETVTVTIRNFSGTPIDFAVNNVTVTVTATGGYNSNVVLTSGVLANGATQDVVMPATIDMSANGTYTFNALTSVTGDITPGNDAMNPVNRVALTMGGTFTVGAGGNFTTLTAAVASYNSASCFTGPVVFSLTDAAYNTGSGETFPIVINANALAGTNTLTIRPASGVNATITGAVGTGSIIKLNGADYIIIDGSNNGSTSRNLTIQNTTATTSGNAVLWLSSPAAANGSTNNTIKNSIIEGNSSTTSFLGMYIGGNATISLTAAGLENNNNNTIDNNLFRKTQYGLAMYGFGAATPDNNNVISNNSFGTVTAGEGFNLEGIHADRQNNLVVSGNDVQNVRGTSTTNMYGIRLLDFKNGQAFNNRVHNLSYTGTSTTKLYGIAVQSTSYTTIGDPSASTIYNNLVYDITSTATSAVWNTTGMFAGQGYGDKYYFNSIHLTGQINNSTSGLSAAFANGDDNITTFGTNLDVRNNIFNFAGSSAGGNVWAYYSRAANLTGTVQNNNVLRCAGTGATNNTARLNAINYTTLAAWTAASLVDGNSIESDPLFNTPTNLVPQTGSPVVGAGVTGTGITTDITGFTRGNPPTIGAYEQSADVVGPVITYTPLSFTCATGDRALNGVTITDASGVPVAGALQPRVYYKKGVGGTWFSSQGTLASGSGTNGTWNFNIVAADMGGLTSGDVVYYYVIAQDIAGTPNIASNPAAGLVATDVNTVVTPPTTPNTFAISASLSGTYTVGASGNYPTITAAVNAYNTSCLTGAVVFNLIDAAYPGETFPITINANAFASSTNTLTIKTTLPNTTISGSSASGIFVLNGADYVTLDGSVSSTANTVCPASAASRDLTISNTNTGTASAIIWLQTATADGATNNTVKNCILSGNSNTTTLFAIGSGSSTIAITSLGSGNNNNSFVNNSISKTQYGIYSQGASAGNKNSGLIINQNLINTAAPDNVARGGIWAGFTDNVTISGNNISGMSQTSSPDVFGITCGFGTTMGATTAGANEVTNATISNNTVGSIVNSGTFSAYGIGLAAATSGTSLIANNTISGVAANGTAGDFGGGIVLGGGTGSVTNVYHNTVVMQGTVTGGTASTQVSACLWITNSTAPTVDIRNNIFVNTQLGNTGATMKHTAIGVNYTSTLGNYAGLTSDNNDLYSAGAGPGTYMVGLTGGVSGTPRTTLADWQTETGRDAVSKNVLPAFTSSTDLHLVTPNTINFVNLESAGAVVSVTNDMDCQTRPNGTAPDIGADEFVGANPACPDVTGLATANITSTTVDLNWNAAGGGAIGYQYAVTTSATPPGSGTSIGTNSVTGAGPLTPGTLYYAHVRTDCGSGVFSNNWSTVSFTTLCASVNIPYLETFDAVTAPAVPVCVTVQNVGNNTETWRTVSAPDDPVSAPNFMRLDYEGDLVTPADDWFFTAGLNLTGGTSYRLRFNYRNSDATTYIEKLEVRYGTGPNAASMIAGAPGLLFSNTNINFNTWTDATIIDFTPSVTGVYYVGFHGFSDPDQAFLCVDNVNVIVTPVCEPPTNVSVGTITGSSALVSFTSAGSNFIVEYGPVGFTPGTGAGAGGGTITTGTASPISITGLTGGTAYDVYVRRDCGAGSYSPNTLPYTFITGPANDDAPGALTLTVGAGCTGAAYTNVAATASASEVFPSCSGVIQAPVWFKFVAPASGAVRISTDLGSGNTLTDSKVGLFSAGNVNDYATFSIISCDEDGGSALGSGFMSVVYATGLTAGTTYYIAVDKFGSSTSNGTFCIAVDELSSAMIAASNNCGSTYQTPFGSNATYTGWQPLVDGSSRLVALVRNPAGGEVDDYGISQNVNVGAVRTDPTSGQRYLDRNFRITNATATNVNVQFFFLNSELTALQAVDPATNLANLGITQQTETVSGCHANYATANGTSTYLLQSSNGSVNGVSWIGTTTPSFSNFYLHTSKAPVTVKTFLQGAYSVADLRHKNVTAAWATILNNNATNQPYNVAPFNYIGTESVSNGFFVSTGATTDVLDWVLLELRDATTPATVISRRAAFIREDGAIVDLDGTSSVSFRGVANGNYHLAIRHRNHLGMRTSVVQVLNGSLGSNPAPGVYDFTISQAQAFDNPIVTTNDAMAQNGAVFMMWAGNANLDEYVRVTPQAFPAIPSDAAYILGTILGGLPNATVSGYSVGDINMDGSVRATPQAFPAIPSDVSVILGTPLGGSPNATRREHK